MRALGTICLLLLPGLAAGEEFVADAFGLHASGDAGSRAEWAGYRRSIGAADERETVSPETVDRLLYFLGPKSLVAGKDEAHAVVIAVDRFGNLVADGLGVEFAIGGTTLSGDTVHGISDVIFTPPPEAGTFASGASAGARQTARAIYRVVADLASVQVALEPVEGALRQEALVDLATAEMQDRFGNTAETGTQVSMILNQDDATFTLLSAPTIDGRADLVLLTRDLSGRSDVRTTLASNQSDLQSVTISPILPAGLPEARAFHIPELHASRVVLGPFVTESGHLLVDGASIEVSVQAASGVTSQSSTWSRDGYGTVTLPIAADEYPIKLDIRSPLGLQTREIAELQEDGATLSEVME